MSARLLSCAFALWFGVGCATWPASDELAIIERPKQLEERQLIVAISLVTPALRADLARSLARQHDLEIVGAFPLTSIEVHCVVFEVPEGRAIEAVSRALAADPRVQLVQRNRLFQAMGGDELGDPYANYQYGAVAVGADRVHRVSTGRGVRLAVIDTGVDLAHPELQAGVVLARNFVEGGDRSFERDEHGTGVAGIIAARKGNGEGGFGVAPDAELLVAKACAPLEERAGKAFCSSWSIARAVDFAIERGAKVLNLSLAGPPDPLLERLLARAHEEGVVVVAAAGDAMDAPAFPASLDTVIAVVASDAQGEAPAPEWGGETAALVAPGMEILTTAPGGGYAFLSGSSCATAYVAGAIALLLESDPSLAPARVMDLLRASPGVEAKAALTRLDACAAIDALAGQRVCE